MSKITADEVRKVANLARIALEDDHVQLYTNQLEKILEYIAQLEKIDTSSVPPTARAVEVVNITRPDEVINSNNRDQILELSPQREGDFFRVPKILAD